ncbi:hypothetical protein H5410_013724, partial [Solanum commersonii]
MEKAFTFCLLTVLLLLQYVIAQTNITTDQLALLSLKSQIISDPFHYLDGSWSPATSVCRWAGVTCGSHHQRVKSLNLSNMLLEAEFHKICIFILVLKNFYSIFQNVLPGEIPKINNLVEPEEFDVGFNSFSGSLAMETFNKSRLRIISLAYNNISGTLPSNIGSILPNVEELYLNSLTN